MKWSDQAWAAASHIIEKIKQHPFLLKLADGTLPFRCFHQYISQDRLYLECYTRVLAHIASRLPEMEDVNSFLKFALDGVAVEKALHEKFNPDVNAIKSEACEFYTSYLMARYGDDIAIETASVLPCFWVYLQVGKYILSIAHLENNPYSEWIKTYSDPEFESSTLKAIEICDRLADKTTYNVREEMTRVFVSCTHLEWLFWNSAYSIGTNEEHIK